MIVEIAHKEQKKALLVALIIAKFNLLIILVFNVKMVILNFINFSRIFKEHWDNY